MTHHSSTSYSSFFPPSAARYYPSAPLRNRNSDLSIWLSVDPMSDKYPNLSPYVYCADNPVRLVDEDGREVCYGGDPLKSHAKFEQFFYKKIAIPLENKAKSGADLSELETEAASLAKQYQKKLLRGYGSTKTDWNAKEMIDIKVFSETKEKSKSRVGLTI